MTLRRSENSPFERSEVLAEDYIPAEILGRDGELEQIEEIFQQIIDREQPVNSFIYGISGTGKTLSIKYKQQELDESLQQYDDVHVEFIYQNCESLTSSYQTAIAITNSYLEDPSYKYLHKYISLNRPDVPNNGLPKERVYNILSTVFDHITYRYTDYREQIMKAIENWENSPADLTTEQIIDDKTISDDILQIIHTDFNIKPPEEVRDYIVVVLDEIDRIGTRDELLYEIPRSRVTDRVANVYPSVIGISNDIGYKNAIQSKLTLSFD
jgi:Cdc6-related protein, AAA superfamily ATPase